MQTIVRDRLVSSTTVLPAFAATLFFSAGLMFLVEPMVARMVLPRLGGSPAVWSTCLVFFQAVLLLGYAYAHALTRLFPRSVQIVVHVFLVLPLATLVLPLDLGAGAPMPGEAPPVWLLTRLALAVGPPMFAISSTAPLLQRWFAELDHKAAGDPYFLYAASNAGSLLALLAYPFLVEPALSLDQQAISWSCGFGALALGIGLCGAVTFGFGQRGVATMLREAVASADWRDRLGWTVLAFVPSSLLLGVTMHISTDIAAAPLLWVVPLFLYLLTFVLAFARRQPLRHSIMVRVMPMLLILLVIVSFRSDVVLPLPVLLALHLSCFFAIGMVCHGELARRRPAAARLTEFYFFLSLGGALGGIFNALLAPVLFPGVWEYPLALIFACLVKPATQEDTRPALTWDIVLPLTLLGLMLLARRIFPVGAGPSIPALAKVFDFTVPALVLLNFSPRRWRFALGISASLLVSAMSGQGDTIATDRSFFGVYRVVVFDDGQTRALVLKHGTTLHGVKSLMPGEDRLPMGYYSHEGPFGRFFAALAPDSVRHVAVVGLGTGELACYAKPGQDWTFYEIDPLVEKLARDPRYFQFLAKCGNQPHVVLGDARLSLASVPDAYYDVLILDAFSSDSIPIHLLTREALSLYLRKLAPGGRILFHISSRTLNLRPVLGSLAADAGVSARVLRDDPRIDHEDFRHLPSEVVAIAGRGSTLDNLNPGEGWQPLAPGNTRTLWTDQRSDLLAVIRF